MIQKKHQSTALRAATSFVLLFSLIISPETSTANASANTEPNATSQQQSNDKIKLLDSKPEVADIPKHNKPNRIITNINGNPQSEMGFSWYTSDKFEDAKVWVSES